MVSIKLRGNMSDTVDIKGLDKAELLAALYNNARTQGKGFFHGAASTASEMTKEDAQKFVDRGHLDFDYLSGRTMKIDISGDTVETWLYDRDNGEGKAAEAIDAVRKGEKIYSGLQIPKNREEEAAQEAGDAKDLLKKLFGDDFEGKSGRGGRG